MDVVLLNELRDGVEKARRVGNYVEMRETGGKLLAILGHNDSPGAANYRAKLHYEFAMADFKQENFPRAIYFAELSAKHAIKAGDKIGELFALMVKYNAWTAQSLKREALNEFDRMGIEADALFEKVMSDDDRGRLTRLIMNITIHRAHLASDLGDPVEAVIYFRSRLMQNELFKKGLMDTDPWARDHLARIDAYISSKR